MKSGRVQSRISSYSENTHLKPTLDTFLLPGRLSLTFVNIRDWGRSWLHIKTVNTSCLPDQDHHFHLSITVIKCLTPHHALVTTCRYCQENNWNVLPVKIHADNCLYLFPLYLRYYISFTNQICNVMCSRQGCSIRSIHFCHLSTLVEVKRFTVYIQLQSLTLCQLYF